MTNNGIYNNKTLRRALCCLTALALLFCAFGPVPGSAESVSDLKDKISDYQDKIDEAEKKLDKLDGDIDEVSDYIAELDSQIEDYRSQIDAYNEQIDAYEEDISGHEAEKQRLEDEITRLNGEIKKCEDEISALETEIDENFEELKDILRVNYVNGETSVLEILLTCRDFSDFLTREQLVSSIADRQDSIINEIKGKIEKINEDIAAIEEQKEKIRGLQDEIDEKIAAIRELEDAVEADKSVVEEKEAAMQAKIDKSNSYLSELNDQSDEYKSMIESYEADIKALNNEISELLRAQASRGSGTLSPQAQSGGGNYSVSSAGFICPVSISGLYVSSGFYYRTNPITGASEHHGGLDLAAGGIYGCPVHAAAGGTVIRATYHYSWGNYVMIDHGNGLATLYAHMSGFAVGYGQHVSQGDTVGYVGSTGYSTGPHLHFEVYVNGSRVNPAGYITVG